MNTQDSGLDPGLDSSQDSGQDSDRAARALGDRFLGWQCRIRQHAMRRDGGRPGTGMQPRISGGGGETIADAVTVLIVPREPEETTGQFRHITKRTHDPKERFDKAVQLLSSTYFQSATGFCDAMTALFGPGSAVAAKLRQSGECVLEFSQFSQAYRIPCSVARLDEDDPAFQATFWHNALFNPNLPAAVEILAFTPDWTRAEAEPMA